jgi:poly(hydroxyalkanoate) granule-associated protein
MVKKLHATPTPAPASKKTDKSRKAAASGASKAKDGKQDSALAKSVKDSAQHIWLAGMGAFSKVQEEGTKAFEALVKEGQSLQRKTQEVAEEKIGEVAGKMTSMAGTVQARANQNWDKLETIFEARTAKAMSKLGVPTAKDVEALVRRVDALAAAVAKLSRQGAANAEPATPSAQAPRRRAASKSVSKVPVKAPVKAARKVPTKAPTKAPTEATDKAPAKRTRKSAASAA